MVRAVTVGDEVRRRFYGQLLEWKALIIAIYSRIFLSILGHQNECNEARKTQVEHLEKLHQNNDRRQIAIRIPTKYSHSLENVVLPKPNSK